MQQTFPFTPRNANQTTPTTQVNVAVTAAVQQVTLPNSPLAGEATIRITVDGTQAITWCYGTQGSLSVGNGVFMLPNTVETFTCPSGITTLSVIAAATGSTFRVHLGDGI